MIVNCKDILEDAYKGGYAIGSYNVHNLEWAKYILEASKAVQSKVKSSVENMKGLNVDVVNVKIASVEVK